MQERWVRLRRSLWQPPRPHGEQPRERVVGPLELFYDLAVVVLVAQAAHRLAGHLSWAGLGQFAVVFTLVWIAWANGSLHHELHGHDDARARSTFLLQILVLAAMGAFIPQAGGARGAAFAVAAAVLFAVLAVLWLLAARGDRPEYRRPSRLFVAGTAACAVLLAAPPCSGRRPRVRLGRAGRRLPRRVLRRPAHHRPGRGISSRSVTERFGAFIIIVLGETLTGVVTGLSSGPVSALTLAVGLAAVVVGFAGQRQAPNRTAGQRAVDARPPAAHGRGRRDGRRHGQPRRPRPRRPHPGRHGVGAGRGRRRPCWSRRCCWPDPRPDRDRACPAARPYLRGASPSGSSSCSHPLGIRRRPRGRAAGSDRDSGRLAEFRMPPRA